jgi:hypothetical protein
VDARAFEDDIAIDRCLPARIASKAHKIAPFFCAMARSPCPQRKTPPQREWMLEALAVKHRYSHATLGTPLASHTRRLATADMSKPSCGNGGASNHAF